MSIPVTTASTMPSTAIPTSTNRANRTWSSCHSIRSSTSSELRSPAIVPFPTVAHDEPSTGVTVRPKERLDNSSRIGIVCAVELIGTAEAAQIIGVERSTLSHWIAKGRITPAQKLPGKTGVLLFPRKEVERVRDEYAASPASTGEGEAS